VKANGRAFPNRTSLAIIVKDIGIMAVGFPYRVELFAFCKLKGICLKCFKDKLDIGPNPVKWIVFAWKMLFDKVGGTAIAA
jgi:hypothetical protein